MIVAFPLTIVPLMLYNLAMLGLMGAGGIDFLNDVMLALDHAVGRDWTMQLGDLFIVIALVMLFFEILKATRNRFQARCSIICCRWCCSSSFWWNSCWSGMRRRKLFFILMTVAFIDVIGGFTVSIRSAGRDVSIGL